MMIVQRHESTTRDPAVRGTEVGERFRTQIADSLDGYWRLFDAKGIDRTAARDAAHRILDAVGDWSPSLGTELTGLAAGAGLEPWEAALMSGRTEISALAEPSGHGECSTAVHIPADGTAPRTLQTWDWYMHLAKEALAWSYVTDAGRTVHGFTELGILGKVGINDRGLGSHINMLNHVSDSGAGACIPIHLIARRIHDEASTIEEAVEIVRGAPLGASTVLTVVSYDGERPRAAFVETSPVGVAVIEGEPGETLRHTNHFLDPELARGESSPEMGNTLSRLDALDANLDAMRIVDPRERAIQLVAGLPGGGPVCVSEFEDVPEFSWETKATLSLDFDAGMLRYSPGTPLDLQERGWDMI